MKKVTIVTVGYFPVPAVKGGAVENIVENIVKVNETKKQIDLCIFTCFDNEAYYQSKQYKNTSFEFIKIPKIIEFLDKLVYFFAKSLFTNNMSYRFIFQRLYYILMVSIKIRKKDYGSIVLENHASLFLILKLFSNYKKYSNRYYFHVHNKVRSFFNSSNVISGTRKIIGVSNYINKENRSVLNPFQIETVVLRNKIDQKQFLIKLTRTEEEELRRNLGIELNDKIILFAGRITKEKGIRELIKAFNSLNTPNIKLLIIGSYYFKSSAKNTFEESLRNEINDKIKFTGYVDYDQVPKFYALADIVVLPSIWDDPAPLTVIEAITSSNVLITTNSGGIPEYASETSIILKRDKNLVENIKISIIELLDNTQKLDSLRKKSLEISKDWTIDSYYEEFYNIIEDN